MEFILSSPTHSSSETSADTVYSHRESTPTQFIMVFVSKLPSSYIIDSRSDSLDDPLSFLLYYQNLIPHKFRLEARVEFLFLLLILLRIPK